MEIQQTVKEVVSEIKLFDIMFTVLLISIVMAYFVPRLG